MRALFALLCSLALCAARASAQEPAAPQPAPAPAPAPASSEALEPTPAPEAVPAAAPPAPTSLAAPANAASTPALPAPVAAPAEHEPPALMTLELNAGLGVGTRSYERPYGVQPQELETTPFAALDLALRAKRCASDCATTRYALEFLLRYQTSLGMKVEQPLLFALPSEVDARSSRLELSVAPLFRLGASRESLSIAVPIGASVRALQAPHRDLPLPSYLLFGPHLRIEGRATLGDVFALRAGPELQWIAMVSERLQNDGTASTGFAFGFELAASAALSSWLGLELTYRQAHALLSGRTGRADFEDVERYVALQLSGRL